MQREYHRWHSPHLGRDMELLAFGHAGAKVLIFPTREGRFYEYENLRLVDALAPKIDAGHLQLWCVDGIASETFYSGPWRPPIDRMRRHSQYEAYLLHEVLPLMQQRNPHACTIAHGCSLGAYQAANLAFRHPHLFQKLVAFSGRYDLTLSVEHFDDLLGGHYDEDVYFHTPSHFLPQLDCAWRLEHLRRMDIVLTIGADDPFLDNNRRLSAILDGKGIGHRLHVWDGRAHCGGAWRRMARLYV